MNSKRLTLLHLSLFMRISLSCKRIEILKKFILQSVCIRNFVKINFYIVYQLNKLIEGNLINNLLSNAKSKPSERYKERIILNAQETNIVNSK